MSSEFGNHGRIRDSRILRSHKPAFEVATQRDDDYLIVRITASSRTAQRTMKPARRAEIMREIGEQIADIAAGMLLEAEEIEAEAWALEQALDACEASAKGET